MALSDMFWSMVRIAGKHPLALSSGSAMCCSTPLSSLLEDTLNMSEDKPAFHL